MDGFVEIEILNFDQYMPRKDISDTKWVRFEVGLLTHPDFFRVTGDGFKVFFHFIQIAGKMKKSAIRMDIEHTAHVLRLDIKTVESTIQLLHGKRWKLLEKHGSVRNPYAGVQEKKVTDTDPCLDKKRREEKREEESFVRDLWSAHTPSLPRINSLTEIRKRRVDAFVKEFGCEALGPLFRRVESSDFLSGRDGKWLGCSFDWVFKPANLTKILEGNYDNRNDAKKTIVKEIIFGGEAS